MPPHLPGPLGGVVIDAGDAPQQEVPQLDGGLRPHREGRLEAAVLGEPAARIGGQELPKMEGPDSQRIGQKPDGRQAFQRGRRGAQQPDKDPEEDRERMHQLRQVQKEGPALPDLFEERKPMRKGDPFGSPCRAPPSF